MVVSALPREEVSSHCGYSQDMMFTKRAHYRRLHPPDQTERFHRAWSLPQSPQICSQEKKIQEHTRHNNRITFSRKLYGLHSRIMSTPPPHRPSLLNIPEKHLSVTSNTSKSRVITRDCDVQHSVSMSFILLNR